MGLLAVNLVLVLALGMLHGPTMVDAEAGAEHNSGGEDTTTNTTRKAQDNQCLLRRQDLINAQLRNEIDTRLNERDSPLNVLGTRLSNQLSGLDTHLNERDARLNDLSTRQTEFDTRFNRMESRLDGIETAITDMKDYLQERMEAMDRKVEWALTDIKPRQDGIVKEVNTTQKTKLYGGCQDALAHGVTYSGIYTIVDRDNSSQDVFCEQSLDGGGWTVFQVRYNGSVDFYQDWQTYRIGFGDLRGEFWLGNEKIYQLTKHHDQQLKIELTSVEGEVKYADYREFWVAAESDQYRLTVTGFSGGSPPGDSMGGHNGNKFSTKDAQGSNNCVTSYMSAWWNDKTCHYSNLNGMYGSTEHAKGLTWFHWKGYKVSMMGTRMMFRKRP